MFQDNLAGLNDAALPDGKYAAVLANSEMKATKAGAGQYLELTWDIAEGEHKGRKWRARLAL